MKRLFTYALIAVASFSIGFMNAKANAKEGCGCSQVCQCGADCNCKTPCDCAS